MEFLVDCGMAGMSLIVRAGPAGPAMITAAGGLHMFNLPWERLMSRMRAVLIVLTASERKMLKKRVYGHKTPYRDRFRAKIVFLASRGWPNARIARELG